MIPLQNPRHQERIEKGSDSTGMTGSRKLYVKSFGCQMNVYDFTAYGGHLGA